MAVFRFESSNLNGMIRKIEKYEKSEEVYIEAISSGQEIMRSAIESGARKHKRTGVMASSVKSSTPVQNRSSDWVGRVKFYGQDKKTKIPNWYKAIWLEYGTSKQKATPFVRPAIQNCESNINKKMQQVFDRKIGELE